MRSGNEEKLKCASVPLIPFPVIMSLETVPAVLQVTPVQLQRFWRLFRCQEWSEEDDNKVFFHLTRACASVFADDVIFSGKMKRTRNRISARGLLIIPMLGYFVEYLVTYIIDL